jgi:hypothetical protein
MPNDWKPVVITTKPGEEPVPVGVIDVTEETLGNRSDVASINEFRARLDAKRIAERSKLVPPTNDDPPPRAA